MTWDITLRVPCGPETFETLMRTFFEFCASRGVPHSIRSSFAVVLDEVLSNILSYAHPQGHSLVHTHGSVHTIGICLAVADGHLEAEITDDGVPFDPLRAPEPDVTLGLGDRPLGGLGIAVVRRLMNRASYARRDGLNVLRLAKLIRGP